MSVFRYKGLIGSIEIDSDNQCLYGKLLYVNDLVTYEATTVSELEIEFKNSVREYLETCEMLGREPMKPFGGSLNIWIGSELHKDVVSHAAIKGMSLNEYIKFAVKNQINEEDRRQL